MTFQPQPDPMQQAIQQAQLDLLHAQIALTQAQASEAGTKGMLNQSKVPVEAARANHIQSSADKNNLDFLQEQNGTKHQQQMELNRQKTDEQMAMEGFKSEQQSTLARLQHNLTLLQQHAKSGLDARTQRMNNAGRRPASA
jgi:type II secretory pathway component PulM